MFSDRHFMYSQPYRLAVGAWVPALLPAKLEQNILYISMRNQLYPAKASAMPQIFRLFLIFLYLGCTSFGGPAAHLGYFRAAFVQQRKWLTEQQYADLVALCQFMPGPASSQVGLSLGLLRGGYLGALAAWLGFTLPSAVLLTLFALGLNQWQGAVLAGAVHGLKIAAVAVVAQAVWQMGRQFCRSTVGCLLMLFACAGSLWLPGIAAQIIMMLVAAGIGALLMNSGVAGGAYDVLPKVLSRKAGWLWLILFTLLLIGLPWLAADHPAGLTALADKLYRTGALVFGGGHVVLPVLQAQTVPLWLSEHTFLAGYGAAQAVPGPLFTLAAFLGAAAQPEQAVLWAAVATLAIFLPSFLMVFGLLPFWSALSRYPRARAMLNGINAAVVGILLAALYQPVWTSAVQQWTDALWAVLVFGLLMSGRVPAWLLVLSAAMLGAVVGLV